MTDEKATCTVCGHKMEPVRPGKDQCNHCEAVERSNRWHDATGKFHTRMATIFSDFEDETTITTKTFAGDGHMRLWGLAVTKDDGIPAIVWIDRDDPECRVHECWLDGPATEHLREILSSSNT